MKTTYLTDTSTNLCSTLLNQYDIACINSNNSILGSALYSLDSFISAGFDVVYYSSSSNYDSICTLAKKVLSLHANNSKITVINIDSSSIGKNNLVLRCSTQNLNSILLEYKVESIVLICNDCLPVTSSILRQA